MDGHEFVRIYDNLFGDRLSESVRGISSEGSIDLIPDHPHLDGEFLDVFGRAFAEYAGEFDYLTLKHTVPISDTGYRAFFEGIPLGCSNAHTGRTKVVATAVAFCDDVANLSFPIHGLTVEGRTGRVVLFPAHWTHPYKVSRGVVVKSDFFYNAG